MNSDRGAPDDRPTNESDAGRRLLADWRGTSAVLLLAIAASASGLVNGFAYDDRPLILDNPRVHHLAQITHLWAQTYWPPWMGAGLYRPLTMSAFALEWWLGGGAPWVFHLVNVGLYALASVLVYGLARLLLPRGAALVAAALFAVHPLHVEAVANVVGQSELWAACGVMTAVILYVRWRRAAVAHTEDGEVPGAAPAGRLTARLARPLGADAIGGIWHAVALVAVVVGACLAKEHAVITPLLLFVAELLAVADPRPARQRWRALRPLALLLLLAVVGYVGFRMHVVGAVAGDRPNVVLEHLSPAARRWTMLGVVSEWARLLVWPARLVAEYAPRDITLHDRFGLDLVPNAVTVLAVLLLCGVSLRRWPVGAFALLWIGLTLVLISNLLVPTGVVLAERTLFLPSVGAVLLAGAVWARFAPGARGAMMTGRGRRAWRRLRGAVAAAFGAVVAMGLWRSVHRQVVWRSNATLFAQAPLDAPLSYRAHDVYAGLLFDRGDNAGGEREARIGLALYRHDPLLYRDLAQEYMRAGLCGAAIPLLRQSIAERGTMETDARLLLAECLLAQHDPRAARDEILRGTAEGSYALYGRGYHRVLLAIDSVLVPGPVADRGRIARPPGRPSAGGSR